MLEEFSKLLAVNDFLPHGYCISWSPALLWTLVISDITIFLSYFSMPLALVYFARRRHDFPYRWLLWLFAAFIMACGTTHLMGAIVLWEPMYRLEALFKAITALFSVVTAVAIWSLIPYALKLPSSAQLRRANEELQREIVERRRVDELLLRAKEAAESGLENERILMSAIIESSDDAIIGKSLDGNVISWNHGAEKIFGYSAREMIGQSIYKIVPPERQDEEKKILARIVQGKSIDHFETERICKDGRRIGISVTISPIIDGQGQVIGAAKIARDITAHKATEAKIQRQAQLYAALSQCNEAIVRCTSEEELFPQICRAAVQSGGMKLAWIGLIDSETQTVWKAAGFDDGSAEYQQHIEVSLDPASPYGRGPTVIAIRENRPYWCQDFLADPITASWRERSAAVGIVASASLPLYKKGVVYGAFILFSGEANAFDESARHLLTEMATDIDFALDNFAREAQRKRAEEELSASEGRFRSLVEQEIAGIYMIQDGKVIYVNPRAAEIAGLSSQDELIGTDVMSFVAEADRSKLAEGMRSLLNGEAKNIALDFDVVRPDGVTIHLGANAAFTTYDGRPTVIGMMQDISEKKHAAEAIQHYIAQLKTAFMSTVQVAMAMSELRDPYTAGHEHRVGEIAVAIGAELGLDAQRLEGLRVAGYLHDIGKITIPSEILSKPGKLSAIEYRMIQGHPQAGYDVLKDVAFPWPIAQVALQHHERIDGSGYPHGLKSEAILFEARIMAVADVVEAMSSHRPYRPGLGIDMALAEIERGRGSAYDAGVADACLKIFREKGYELP